ncbi:MAG TPA: hypothetical protein VMH90_03750, partial [Thermoplasmata archaeon]|nr:hypothetical protein [Thermoplasmata archaeon]
MRPTAIASGSLPRRSLRSPLTAAPSSTPRWGRWLLVLTVLAFALPTGAVPLAGAGALPTHLAGPVPLALPAPMVRGVAAPAHGHQLVLGSVGAPGPRLTPAELNAVVVRPPEPNSVKAALAMTSSTHASTPVYSGPAKSLSLQQLGLHTIEQRLRNSSSLPALPK